ncbi:MAG TPA: S-methyl-5-thioribose-1-phosphate isomerase [Bacteroidota bacterium]
MHVKPIEWAGGKVRFLDQTLLPDKEIYVETDGVKIIAEAIRRLAIRGAPLIGIAAAYGTALAMNSMPTGQTAERSTYFKNIISVLSHTRPTAVNLSWSLQRLRKIFHLHLHDPIDVIQKSLLAEALAIHQEDAVMCKKIGENGARLLPERSSVLTHCNTGRLATGGIGTALGVIETAWELRKLSHVYIDETRPLLQGARLTAWELGRLNIPATLVVDSAAGFLMQSGRVTAVVVGADRIAANGDAANKIGTYALAVLAKYHRVPFYIAAPSSTLDFDIPSGDAITIEQRAKLEVSPFFDTVLSQQGIDVDNPAFDVTPHELISAIITEHGVVERPSKESLAELRSKVFEPPAKASAGALS